MAARSDRLCLAGKAEACWLELWAAAVLVLPRRDKPLLVLLLQQAPRGSVAGPR